MHFRQSIQFIDQTFATATRLGAKVPKSLAAERDRIATLAAATRDVGLGTGDVAAAVLAALEVGSDPATDAGVLEAVVRRAIVDHGPGIEDRLARQTLDFLSDNAEDIIGMFAQPFDQAAALLRTTYGHLGDVSLKDSAAVLAQGGNAAHHWADARDADKVIRDIYQVWKLASIQIPGMGINPHYKILVIADIDAATFISDDLRSQSLDPWAATCRGYTLSLATPSTFRQRIAAVQGEGSQREARAADDARAERRRTHGITV